MKVAQDHLLSHLIKQVREAQQNLSLAAQNLKQIAHTKDIQTDLNTIALLLNDTIRHITHLRNQPPETKP